MVRCKPWNSGQGKTDLAQMLTRLCFQIIVVIILITGLQKTYAQGNTQSTDSLKVKLVLAKKDSLLHQQDTLRHKVVSALDSVQSVNSKIVNAPKMAQQYLATKFLQQKTKSTDTTRLPIDSLKQKTKQAGDSIRLLYSKADPTQLTNKVTEKVGGAQQKLTSKVDSLNVLKSPTAKYTNRLDSLSQINPLVKVEDKIETTQDKVNRVLDKPEAKVNEKINVLSKEAGGQGNLPANINAPDLKGSVVSKLPNSNVEAPTLPDFNNPVQGGIPALNTPTLSSENASLPHLKKIENPVQQELGAINPKEKIDKITSSAEVKQVQEGMAEVTEVSGKVSGYAEDAKKIANGDVKQVETIKDDLVKVVPVEGADAVKEQLALADQQKAKMNSYRNPEAFKKQTLARAREVVMAQFATQQSKLTETVAKVSAYQKKGESVFNNVKGLPKRPVKSKKPPLIERFVPGVTTQVQKTNLWLVDVNPTLKFRVRSIFSIGGGWNERIAIDQSGRYQVQKRVYGVRSFSEFSIRKGLSLRADVERMKAFVPFEYVKPDEGSKQWVWSYMAGVRKDFSFGKHVMGNVQFMYNLYDPERKSPYLKRLNVRFGFEFPLKAKKIRH